ncbi:hypothetical protein [uncultured Dysosmobacter sp.]|uniref:hypothetical protein n=1 Tax=uncultured Dysosmobacter sp. TaxID=2591384 RepID=UPI002611B057|nr:hypothetical protein [uncultured Dysosmobacter sp.]
MKPILFNAEMAQAVREGRKTVTRRAIKPQPTYPRWNQIGWLGWDDGHGYRMRQPYQDGEVLYVPEPWRCMGMFGETGYVVGFKDGETVRFMFRDKDRAERWAKYGNKPFEQWQSPYFMPREAARLFLRAEDVRVERLHDITEEQAIDEGARYTDFGEYTPPWKMSVDGGKTFHGAKPIHHPGYHFKDVERPDQCFESARSAFANYWGSTIKAADRALYGWAANPWVWVIRFKRIGEGASAE